MYFYAKKTLYLNITRQDESNDTKIYCIKLKKKKTFFWQKGPPLHQKKYSKKLFHKGGPFCQKIIFFFFNFIQ
jgi:hypothetical protein